MCVEYMLKSEDHLWESISLLYLGFWGSNSNPQVFVPSTFSSAEPFHQPFRSLLNKAWTCAMEYFERWSIGIYFAAKKTVEIIPHFGCILSSLGIDIMQNNRGNAWWGGEKQLLRVKTWPSTVHWASAVLEEPKQLHRAQAPGSFGWQIKTE